MDRTNTAVARSAKAENERTDRPPEAQISLRFDDGGRGINWRRKLGALGCMTVKAALQENSEFAQFTQGTKNAFPPLRQNTSDYA